MHNVALVFGLLSALMGYGPAGWMATCLIVAVIIVACLVVFGWFIQFIQRLGA